MPIYTIIAEDYFYPRSPCGERLVKGFLFFRHKKFLSTLSLRRATTASTGATKSDQISIHALLAESDAKVHKTVGHFCAYETNFMEIASSC